MKPKTLLYLTLVLPALLNAGYKMGVTRPQKIDPYGQAVSNPRSFDAKRADGNKVDEQPVLDHLAGKYKIEVGQLQRFREMKYGYEELVPSLIVSNASGIELEKILTMRDRGNTWKEIAGIYSINLKPLNKLVMQELKPIRRLLPKQLLQERPAHAKNDR